MTDNIVSAMSRFLTPELIGKLASGAGLDRATAQTAVGASVPALLGALADVASQPRGARQLADAVAEQPAGVLGNLANFLGGPGQVADKGGSLLSSLLGGGTLGTLVSAVSSFAGIGEGATRSLMGLLSPAILGVLGREQRAAGLDGNGLARMLVAQKDQITAAMPAGLSDILKSKGLRASVETRAYDSPPRTYGEAHRMISETKEAPSASWPYWVLPALALAGLLWYMLPSSEPSRTAAVETTAPKTVSVPTRLVPSTDGKSVYLTKAADDSISVGAYYNQDVYNRAGEKLGTMKDLFVGTDGRINAAVIDVGHFLGIGEKTIAVPFSAMQVERRDGSRRFVIDVMKDGLRAAPAFER